MIRVGVRVIARTRSFIIFFVVRQRGGVNVAGVGRCFRLSLGLLPLNTPSTVAATLDLPPLLEQSFLETLIVRFVVTQQSVNTVPNKHQHVDEQTRTLRQGTAYNAAL